LGSSVDRTTAQANETTSSRRCGFPAIVRKKHSKSF
jgi:hypothetical protein